MSFEKRKDLPFIKNSSAITFLFRFFVDPKTNGIFVAVSFPFLTGFDNNNNNNSIKKKQNNHQEHLIYWHPAETHSTRASITRPMFETHATQNSRKQCMKNDTLGAVSMNFIIITYIYFRPFKKFTCCYAIHH